MLHVALLAEPKMPCPIPLAPDNTVCGNGGSCIPDENRCACINGWSGRGDFVLGEPSCNMYLPAIQHLWIPVFVIHLLVAPFSFEYVFRVLLKCSKIGFQKLKHQVGFGLLNLTTNLGIAATAIQKYRFPNQTIGTDVGVTVSFSIGATAFYSACSMLLLVFLEVNVKNAKIRDEEFRIKYDKIMRGWKLNLSWVFVLTVVWMFMPVFMLAASSTEAFFALTFLHYVGAALTMIMVSILSAACLENNNWRLLTFCLVWFSHHANCFQPD
jgi:hypothetical protein